MKTILKAIAIGAVVFLLLTLATMFVLNQTDITKFSEFGRFIIVLLTLGAMAISIVFDWVDSGKL